MLVLGIETSCDETSAAVVNDGRVLANVVSSQVDLHAVYRVVRNPRIDRLGPLS